MKFSTSRLTTFALATLALSVSIGFCNFPNDSVKANQLIDLGFVKGDAVKKDLVSLTVKSSTDIARVVPNFQQQYPKAVVLAIDEVQKFMNELYKPDSVYGDKSSAFIVLVEQYKGGVGKDPVPLVGKTKHALKCAESIVGLNNKKTNLPLLPPEAIARIDTEIQKMQEALNWADSYKAGDKPAIPKWAKDWKSQIGG
jgi:hypothetical protein